LGDAFIKEDLFQEDFLVVGNRSKYRLPRKMMLDTYLKCSHILVSPGGDLRGVVDDLLESKGLQRRVIAALPLFLPALAAVQATNALATVPRRIAFNYAKAFHLVTAEPPLAVRSFSVAAVWHRRDEHNPMHRWLVHRLLAISGTVPLDAVESPQSVVFRVIDCITFHSGQSHGNLRLAPSEMKRALIVLVPPRQSIPSTGCAARRRNAQHFFLARRGFWQVLNFPIGRFSRLDFRSKPLISIARILAQLGKFA
jgi:hypothetical protein